MRLSAIVVSLLPVIFVSAQQTFTVVVGNNGTLTFEPSSVTAQVGDTVSFSFRAKNHTVTQSTFATPCNQLIPGVDSGFMPVAATVTDNFPTWNFTVDNATAPHWFYCKQTGHCSKGMVFALNPTADKTFDAFKAKAIASASNTTATSGTATSPSATGSGAAAPSKAAAMKISSGAGGLLAIAGLVAGLAL